MTRTDRFLRRLSVEPLERRQLLCGSAAGGSVLQSIAQSCAFSQIALIFCSCLGLEPSK